MNARHSSLSMLLLLALTTGAPQTIAQSANWTVKISASTGGLLSKLTLGEHAGAQDGYDALYDAPAHPAPAAVSAYFEHTDWGVGDTKFWYDIKALGASKTWQFSAATIHTGQSLTLTWDLANLPAGYTLTLTEVSSGQSVNMRTSPSYSYSASGERQFEVRAEFSTGAGDTGGVPPDAGDSGGEGQVIDVVGAADEDSDGLRDSLELFYFGHLTRASAGTDSDGDGVNDGEEFERSTDPTKSDTDGDGLSDQQELALGTFPTIGDSDNDGDNDGDEVKYGSAPLASGETLARRRPGAPVISAIEVSRELDGQVLDVVGFTPAAGVAGDALAAAEWEISTSTEFNTGLVLRRTVHSATTTQAVTGRIIVPSGVLRPATRYWVRSRHLGKTGLWSESSAAAEFITVEVNPNDVTGDGVDDRYQVTGFIDTDADGMDDHGQSASGLRTVHTASRSEVLGLRASEGTLQGLTALAERELPASARNNHTWIYGLTGFRIEYLPVDPSSPAEVQVSIYFPQPLPKDVRWRMYDHATGTASDYDHVVFEGNRAIVTLVDGGAGDTDGSVNGVIANPGGPAIAIAPASTGTPLGGGGHSAPWLLLGAAWVLRRRRT